MLEFENTLKEYDKFLKLSNRGFRKGWRSFQNAEDQYKRATQIRENLLQNILDERGFAICSDHHYFEDDMNLNNKSADQLGIYPRNQMRLLYYVYGPYTIQGEYEDSIGMERTLRLLCPEHFPKKPKWHYRRDGLFTNIKSEVIKKDGKFILAVNNDDITELVNKGGPYIDPDGLEPFLVNKEVFRYFGIPDLPRKPDINSVRY